LKAGTPGQPTLVSAMYCNNEIPARQPVEEISRLCEQYGAFFHCDAVQGMVREDIHFKNLGASALVMSPHKIYGPKGVGILLLSRGKKPLKISPPHIGGEQERGLRPGTLNPIGIAVAAESIDHHVKWRSDLVKHLVESDRIFIDEMRSMDSGFQLSVPYSQRCPGIVNFWCDDVDAPSLLEIVDHVCINRGSACSGAGGEKSSHVAAALKLPFEAQNNVLRASFGFATDLTAVKEGARILGRAAEEIRKKLKKKSLESSRKDSRSPVDRSL